MRARGGFLFLLFLGVAGCGQQVCWSWGRSYPQTTETGVVISCAGDACGKRGRLTVKTERLSGFDVQSHTELSIALEAAAPHRVELPLRAGEYRVSAQLASGDARYVPSAGPARVLVSSTAATEVLLVLDALEP